MIPPWRRVPEDRALHQTIGDLLRSVSASDMRTSPGVRRNDRAPSLAGENVEIDGLCAVQAACHRWQRILQTRRTIEQHYAVSPFDPPILEALLVSREGGATFGTHQQAVRARHLLDGRHDCVIADRNRKA